MRILYLCLQQYAKTEVDSQPLVRGQLYKGQLFGNLNGGRLGIQPTTIDVDTPKCNKIDNVVPFLI